MHTPIINVSFGMEFEMIVLYDAKKYEAKLKSGEGVYWHSSSSESESIDLRQKMLRLIRIEMIELLTDHGIPTNTWWAWGGGGHGGGRAVEEEVFTKWTVEHDGTVAWQEDGVQDWCAIELKTPAFFYHPWAMDQVVKALDVVKRHFTTAVVNESCGLHVHVGNCHEGYPLRTLKNFAMLITSFERQFSSLHPADRIVNNHFVRPVSESFGPQPPTRTVWDKLLVIESCRTVEQIIQNFNYDNNKWTAYSFLSLMNPSLRTIEFRQHSGTLDTDAVTHWAKLSISLIHLAHSASHSGFYNLIKAHALEDDKDDESYNIINLLNDLKLPDLAEYYSQPPRKIYHHPVWGSEEWEFQSSESQSISSSNSSRQSQSDEPAEEPPSSYEEDEFPSSTEIIYAQDFSWKDGSASWGADSAAASALIETGFGSDSRNPYQREVEVW